MSPISTKRHGDVLIVISNNPPVNALGHAVREGLVKAIEEADSDESVKAVVIVCQGQTFFAGADITEFGKPMQMPMLPMVVDIIENCTKPVVAAIHGTAFGGGLEVALASHYRVAVPSAKLGVPEVKLGLLPGAGGTQRLPRLAGIAVAIDMVSSGRRMDAVEALTCGLIDRVSQADLLADAKAFARWLVGQPIRRTGEQRVPPFDAEKVQSQIAATTGLVQFSMMSTTVGSIGSCIGLPNSVMSAPAKKVWP